MKTYNTYQEAKIANPESEIVTTGKDWDGRSDLIGKFQAFVCEGLGSHQLGDTSWVKCNPADHCMSMLTFKELGHKLSDGDVYQNEDGRVFTVGKLGYEAKYCNLLSSYCFPSRVYILRAAALENQMNIDNLATQTPEEKEALDLIDTTPHQYERVANKDVGWNGEGLPTVGVECELKYRHAKNANWRKCKVFAYSSEHGSAAAVWHLDGEIWHHHSINTSEYEFRKPETPEQKAERERLEAAYDLYVTAQKAVNNVKIVTYELFTFAETINLIYWLAIVDKTNYRKESN